MKKATCIYIVDDHGRTLMAWQQRKVVGLKGYGGVLHPGETAIEATLRELPEETGGDPERRLYPEEEGGITVDAKDLEPYALIDFYNGTELEVPIEDGPSFRVLFYRCCRHTGNAISTKEMHNPNWYYINSLNYKDMILGDEYFLPYLFRGIPVKGWIRRTSDWKQILGKEINVCNPADLVL